jgi:hypothetical protein
MKKVFYTAIAILGFANLALAQVPSYVPTNGLVGYWPFSGNANDASGNGNNGTVNGVTSTTDRFGKSNSAYFFSLNNYISGNSSNLPKGNRTISIWFNSDSIGGSNGTSLIGYGGGVCGTSHLQLINNPYNGGNQFEIQGHCNNQLVTYNYGSNNHPKGAWFHWTVTTDSVAGTKFYLNGNLISSDNTFLNQTNVTNKIFIFGGSVSNNGNSYYYDAGGMPLHGKLDDIGIWNRALTEVEIRNLYQSCLDTFSTQPLSIIGVKGSNNTFSTSRSDTGNNFQWQSNSAGLGWQNVPNANQYSGVTTNSLAVNGLTVSNHNQLFRVISSKQGCVDTSNIVKLTVSDVATDSLNVITLKTDTTTKGNTIRQLQNDSISKLGIITSLKTDTTNKGNTIRQLQTDLANKRDTLYVGSNITTDTLKISIRTGISTASPIINSLKVYPNPASTLLNIVLEKPGYYVAKLSSVTGQSIITPTIGTIDISALANGVYILTIYDSNNKLISTNKVSIIK